MIPHVRLPLVPAGMLVVGLGAAFGAVGCHKKADAPWKLPIDAKELPPTTSLLEAEVIDGTRETDAHVKQVFTGAELGSEICRLHSSDPARDLEVMSSLGSGSAKRFFKPAALADVQSLMQCGELLATNLDGAFQTAITFTDDTSAKQEVGIIPLKATEIPTQYGFTKHSFSGLDGFCRTTDVSKPNAPTVDCNAGSDAALKQGSSWFFGTRAALESVAHTVTSPKADLSTQVAALNDAANELEGLTSTRISAQLTSAKPFLTAPCTWGGYQTAGSLNDFVQGCFPPSDEKVIQDMDAKIRAAAFEIEPNVLKSGGVHGNVILVARDDDAAKVVEKDAQDLAADWKSQLENNEAKLVKQAKTNPASLRQKSWAIIVDNFTRAMEKIKVSRSGRTVKLAFSESLDDADKRDLADANKETLDKRVAIADLLDAIEQKKPLPPDALGRIVGAPWAAYFVQESTFDPKSLPPECAAAKKPVAVKGKKGAAPTPPVAADPRCAAPVEPPESEFGDYPTKSATK